MSDQRPIQRYAGGSQTSQQTGSIMTPQGPAIIQIIDMPTGLGPVNPPSSNSRRKPGGINVVGAVIRRWWLVLIVFVIVGGGAYFAGANLVKPMYEARAKVGYIDNNPGVNGTGIAWITAHRVINLANDRAIVLRAAQDPTLRAVMPKPYAIDVDDAAQQAALLAATRGVIEIPEEKITGMGVLDIVALQPTPEQASAVANAYAAAFAWYCDKLVTDTAKRSVDALDAELRKGQDTVRALLTEKAKLMADTNFEVLSAGQLAVFQQITNLKSDAIKAEVASHAALQQVALLTKNAQESATLKLKRADIIKAEKERDTILKNLLEGMGTNFAKLSDLRSRGMKDEHPDVLGAKEAIARYQKAITDREEEIAAIVNKKLDDQFKLESEKTLDEARAAKDTADGQLLRVNEEMAKLTKEAGKMAGVREQIELLSSEAINQTHVNQDNSKLLTDAKAAILKTPTAEFRVEQPGVAILKEDKRIKVQAGGLVGGLFLGILLALLVDRFDKRLRDPRDIEPLFGTPLLGCIPRIQELKRIKGDQARNLIAEEFRIIRTQVLFGNPNLSHKLIAVTSPTPGDGKTSLAVNLAISIAKAGRRVLLIDGDLRKPDVHRVFNLSDSPGFAELIQGSHEPGAVIKKSEIEGLEILPAGTPLTRPSELLSRPEMARLLVALGDLYDHIILDTAPLLPVSDTHVLAGMVDAVIVSFNAEVDRDTVSLTQDILRRCRANVIGSVMNQVKYRQSGSYQRGKSAYDSYYNSPRGMPKSDGKSDKLTTIGKN
jgi:succinoglycan biosynthesis transport protein ExoP